MEQITLNEVNENVGRLHQDIEVIKKMMGVLQEFVEDSRLTPEEARNIEIAEKEFADGKTTSLEDLKTELEI